MDQFTKNLRKPLMSNDEVKELFREQIETVANQILQSELTASIEIVDFYDRCGF